MFVHAENLRMALEIAVAEQEKFEKEVLQYTGESAFLAGIREVLRALNRREKIDILQP